MKIFKLLDSIVTESKKKQKGVTLNCFSPPIMLATFIIEITLAVYVYIKSRKASSDVGIVATLVFLGTFQLAEYQVCESDMSTLIWSRIGLFAITFLPVFGLYLISKMNKESKLLKVSFFMAIAFVAYFIFAPQTTNDAVCKGNYIIFDIESNIHYLYGYYYFGFLLVGIWQATKVIKSNDNRNEIKKALKWFIAGYLSFILPLTLVYIFIPLARDGVASIMCGFAVVFAFIMAFKVAPVYHKYVKVSDKK